MFKDEETKKRYFRDANKNIVRLRMNNAQWTLLENMMHREGWNNRPRFIKHRLFGNDPQLALEEMIREGDAWMIENLLINEVRNLAKSFEFIRAEYIKEMRTVDFGKYEAGEKILKGTRRTFDRLSRKTEDIFGYLRLIAEVLHIDSYFNRESDSMEHDPDKATVKQMEEYNKTVGIESIIYGEETFDSDSL